MTSPFKSKQTLLDEGIALMEQFCDVNGIKVPSVQLHETSVWRFGVCAYYRPTQIEICLGKCASIGVAAMAWSYPGYTVDRTPYGVIQHELGHHVDVQHSTKIDRYRGDFGENMRAISGEKPISGYSPDYGEWFAEMFRLFVTNPDLLKHLRPVTHGLLLEHFTPVITDAYDVVLANAPQRTQDACKKKVASEKKPAAKNSTQGQGALF